MKHIAEILEQAIDMALEQKDPRWKLERRRAREARRAQRGTEKLVRTSFFPESDTPRSRYIASEVLERLHEHAGHQCEFEAPDGTRCTSRTGLEVEHTRPFAIYRSHDERFLKIYCLSTQPSERGARLRRCVRSGEDRLGKGAAKAHRVMRKGWLWSGRVPSFQRGG